MGHDEIIAGLDNGTLGVIDLLHAVHSHLIEDENKRRANGEAVHATSAMRNLTMAAVNAWAGLFVQSIVCSHNATLEMVRHMEGTDR